MVGRQVIGSEFRHVAKNVSIGTNSVIVGKRVTIGSGTRIGKDVTLKAEEITIGRRCTVEDRVVASWRGRNLRLFSLGDCCLVGSDSRIFSAEFTAGDYATMHNHILVNGDSSCSVGHNSYVGQNCILNCNAALKIGNNVGIVGYSSVWTHGHFGQQIEGCLTFKQSPVTIGDDVTIWRAVISPGVRIGERAVILNGSVVTEDVPPGSCYGGVPARNLSDKIRIYRRVTMREKFRMMEQFASEFVEESYPGSHARVDHGGYLVKSGKETFKVLVKWELTDADVGDGGPMLAATMKNSVRRKNLDEVTIFDIRNKTYTKRLSDPEVKFIWFLADARARFIPL